MPNENTLKRYLEVKPKFADQIVLIRSGDFYETFDDDAERLAKKIGLTVTAHGEEKLPTSGFPKHSLESHLRTLLKSGIRVAISDE